VIVVADTTPLLYLSRIGQLELLHLLYQQVFVPATVWHEAAVVRPSAPGVEALRPQKSQGPTFAA
jgi:predicted nucleic acid-binding protein